MLLIMNRTAPRKFYVSCISRGFFCVLCFYVLCSHATHTPCQELLSCVIPCHSRINGLSYRPSRDTAAHATHTLLVKNYCHVLNITHASTALAIYRPSRNTAAARTQVLEICAHFGGLQAARTEMMGLFVYDLGPIDEEKARKIILIFFFSTVVKRDSG